MQHDAATSQRIIHSLNGTKPYVLNITDDMAKTIVATAHQQVSQIEIQKQSHIGEYEETKKFYEDTKKQWDSIRVQMENFDEQIKAQKLIIETMGHFRRNAKVGAAQLQVNKEPAVREGTKSKKGISWVTEAENILAKENRYMGPDELFERVVAQPHVKECLKEMKSWASGVVPPSTKSNWLAQAARASRGESSGMFKPVFSRYKDKLGLIDWFDIKNQVPKDPSKMKDFMYAK